MLNCIFVCFRDEKNKVIKVIIINNAIQFLLFSISKLFETSRLMRFGADENINLVQFKTKKQTSVGVLG